MLTAALLGLLPPFLGQPAECAAPRASERPNVIVVLADDLGLGDVGCCNPGSRIATPHLDRLGREGVIFTDAHAPSSVCTPTRYGLLTGRYAWRSRLGSGVLNGYSAPLVPGERTTVADVMGAAGYRTAMIGKWHLGWDWARDAAGEVDYDLPVTNGPDANGFDHWYAFCGSLDMPPYVWVEDGRVTSPPDHTTVRTGDYHWWREGPTGADFDHERTLPRIFERAEAFVAEQARAERPFFLYLPLSAPHTPILPLPPFAGASGINPYADFVMQLDHHVGELLETLADVGLDQDTLVLFASDNGCSPAARIDVLQANGHFPSLAYRGHKADIYEGGHRVPLLARWPAGIPAGRTTDGLASLTDLLATLADLTGQALPASAGEDSYSLLPLLTGVGEARRADLVSHSIAGRFAFRRGPWKLCLCPGSGGWSYPRPGSEDNPADGASRLPPLQLYHLGRDPGERHDVAAAHPEVVQDLLRRLAVQVRLGRSTPGAARENDRAVEYLPAGVPPVERDAAED